MKHPVNGRKLRQFEISFFGSKISVYVVPMFYANGTLALKVYCYEQKYQDYEPFGVLTVNLEHQLQSDDRAFVKTYSENEKWAEELAGQIGEYSGVTARSGYVSLPLYRFDTDKCYL